MEYRPVQMKNALTMVLDLINDPNHPVEHARRQDNFVQHNVTDSDIRTRYAASVVMSMTYGKVEPTYFTDPEIVAIGTHGARLGKIVQIGAHVVDSYPILRYVPFVTSTLRKWHREELALFNSLVNGVREKMVSYPLL